LNTGTVSGKADDDFFNRKINQILTEYANKPNLKLILKLIN